jgi:hypothetical protein
MTTQIAVLTDLGTQLSISHSSKNVPVFFDGLVLTEDSQKWFQHMETIKGILPEERTHLPAHFLKMKVNKAIESCLLF